MTSRSYVSTLALLLFTGACGDDDDAPETTDATAEASTTDAASSTTETAPTTTEAPTTSTTEDGETTGDGTTGDTTTGDATTGDATTGPDTTTGEVDPDALSACQAYCERWEACGFQPDLAGCIEGCADNQIGLAGACKQANLEVLGCFTALGCEDLLGSIEQGGPCSEQEAAVTDVCAGDECSQSMSTSDDACELQIECMDAPLRQMICDGSTCTCLEGGVELGECASEDVCATGDAVLAEAARCCGF
ncbi:hypothetical protein [Nannocystis bainbridge]|uniref:Uncharacterized protein n=1 Tax=Nannocystis bainbridge TaxID=2995303 RepID=A0ABT5DZ38_9BACT|nr:hypothetical protein [Nannocystis bainbridge]MDC0718889.1 hypothetical protein [Nannocystis bainbridge]